MSERPHIGLDNPAFAGRLRQRPARISYVAARQRPTSRPRPAASITVPVNYQPKTVVEPPVVILKPRVAPLPAAPVQPVQPAAPPSRAEPTKLPLLAPQPFAAPANKRTQPSRVLRRQQLQPPAALQNAFADASTKLSFASYTALQKALFAVACCLLVIGLGVSGMTALTNRHVTAQVSALSQHDNQNSDVPSTVKPSAKAMSQYVVTGDLARYLKIPKLGVYARVLQVGVKTDGELGTPNNVYDAAWYTGSAKPGQPGATLIDGHVSSWTTHGVFYGLKTLVAGDTIQIVRGDGTILNYRVVKTKTYDADDVDMQAAITPVNTAKSGLNLITCTGRVKPGTSEFNQRVVVFAEQI